MSLDYFDVKPSYMAVCFRENSMFGGQIFFYHYRRCIPYFYDKDNVIKLQTLEVRKIVILNYATLTKAIISIF